MVNLALSAWRWRLALLAAAPWVASCCAAAPAGPQTEIPAAAVGVLRIKDLGKLQGWRENPLIGHGLVTGLAGTGDASTNRATRQAMSNVLAQFNLSIPADQLQSRNVATVMVTASLPPFARPGDVLDVTVASIGDARSLVGGSLLMAPLRAANGNIHALAQGPLAVGGFRYDTNGNVVQKNHTTVGSIAGGAVVERGVAVDEAASAPGKVAFVLSTPDYTTAARVADAINEQLGQVLADPIDASGVSIHVPAAARDHLVAFLARIESVLVEPDRRARVVINERTGTVVAGGDVRISRVSVSQGDLRVSILAEGTDSFNGPASRLSPMLRSVDATATRIDVDDKGGPGHLMSSGTVGDLVQALARLKTSTRDVISILRAVKAAGALHAELIVQ